MGRRSLHTSEELRTLILDAAQTIVEEGGLASLSARSIARVIGYAPGTLYNVYANIDEILLRVEGRLLDELDAHLAEELKGRTGTDAVTRYATAYFEFARRRPGLWKLLHEHHLTPPASAPEWYLQKLTAPTSRLATVLASLDGNRETKKTQKSATALWSAIHGLSMLATSSKASGILGSNPAQVIDEMIKLFLPGLPAARTRKPLPNGAADTRGSRVA